MPNPYARLMCRWEKHLASRDTDRVVRPFEWGLDWMGLEELDGEDPRGRVLELTRSWVADSDAFFSYERPRDYHLKGSHLTFTSPVATPYPENNVVHAEWLPAPRDRGRAVVVLPQWNAGPDGHIGVGKLLNRFGISALRMSLAYHDYRKPAETRRADYHVSSNIGRTIHAGRQSVIDARACLDWLEERGYERLGILGTSLGSCIAFITAAHDTRVRAGVFNHVSMYFGDVVWTGLSTQHVRQGFGDAITQDELRDYWAVISPASYLERLKGRDMESLLIWARHDTTFLPVYSKQLIERFRALGLRHRAVALPCGHYTTGQFPFNIIDGLTMCRFLEKWL
ncbi:MAG TPA: alpha/beta hydrolase family protein [Bryobacteraceae bacterium]|nr:alpha/beta hydrolase family protein [Bryobacteraceae bacterium]